MPRCWPGSGRKPAPAGASGRSRGRSPPDPHHAQCCVDGDAGFVPGRLDRTPLIWAAGCYRPVSPSGHNLDVRWLGSVPKPGGSLVNPQSADMAGFPERELEEGVARTVLMDSAPDQPPVTKRTILQSLSKSSWASSTGTVRRSTGTQRTHRGPRLSRRTVPIRRGFRRRGRLPRRLRCCCRLLFVWSHR